MLAVRAQLAFARPFIGSSRVIVRDEVALILLGLPVLWLVRKIYRVSSNRS